MKTQKIVGIDTEFVRRYTFWPLLSLIQIATANNVYVIEPSCASCDWLNPFLLDPKITKVFHSCRQDVESFYWFCGVVPQSIFDTQVATSFLGLGDQISYAELVKNLLDVQLTKEHQWSDWSKRPLSEGQLIYAADDARYLVTLSEILQEQLKKKQRWSWFENLMQSFDHLSAHTMDPTYYFIEKIYAGNMSEKTAAALHAVVSWREDFCKKSNKTRGNVVDDDALRRLNVGIPFEEFLVKNKLRQQIYDVMHRDLEKITPPLVWISPPLGHAIKAVKKVIDQNLKHHGIPRKYVITQGHIIDFLTHNRQDTPMFEGWRRSLLEDKMNELMEIQKKFMSSI